MKLTSLCSICNKPLVLVNECQFGKDWYRNYKCGHAFYETDTRSVHVPDDTRRNYDSCTGTKAAFDFQREGIDSVSYTHLTLPTNREV